MSYLLRAIDSSAHCLQGGLDPASWTSITTGRRAASANQADGRCPPKRSLYGTARAADGQSVGSSVLTGTQPSRPSGERHQNQPLVRSSATTSSSSPICVGNSVVSYA